MRYGHRAAQYTDLIDMYKKTRAEGFGAEVKRRILIGTYVLSHGYYDAYYLQGAEGAAPDRRRLRARVQRVRRDHGADRADAGVQARRQGDDPVQMYLNDIFTIAGNLAGCRACRSRAASTRRGLPVGLQIQGNYFAEAQLLNVAHQLSAGDRLARARRPPR